MTSIIRKSACCLLAVLLIAALSLGLADEIRYGITNTRIRVREAPNTGAEIFDNLLPERLVLITADASSGSVQFIGVTYRDATGQLSTGWAAKSDGGKVYVDELSASQAASEFGIDPGTVPDEIAGTSGRHVTVDLMQTAGFAGSTSNAASSGGTTSGTSAGTTNESAELVRFCQQALKDLDIYYGEITGNIGTKTRNSIKVFQRREGLKATGELDDTTVQRLRQAVDPESYSDQPEQVNEQETPSETSGSAAQASSGISQSASSSSSSSSEINLTIDSAGETVLQIQTRLKEMGYYTGSLTGHFGSKTAAAVKLFQKKNGLSQTGVADPATVSAILYGKAAAETETQDNSGAGQSSAASGTVYRKGDQADVIAEMQTCLQDLGIYSGDITGHFGSKTKDSVMTFQRKNGLTVSGELDSSTISAIRQAASGSGSSSGSAEGSGSSSGSSGSSTIYTLDWFTAKNNNVFSHLGLVRGNYATLKDLNTGKSLRVYIQSAGYHLDVEPASASDTSTFLSIYGVSSASSISYKRRPALLTTSQGYRIVCSIYGQPHGQQVITNNNYGGQFCLHFLNSKTSGSGVVDSDHQSAINNAISMTGGSAKKIQSTSDLK